MKWMMWLYIINSNTVIINQMDITSTGNGKLYIGIELTQAYINTIEI